MQFELLAYFAGYEGAAWPAGAGDRNLRALRERGLLVPIGRSRTVFTVTDEGDRLINEYWDAILGRHTYRPRKGDALGRSVPGSYGSRKGY